MRFSSLRLPVVLAACLSLVAVLGAVSSKAAGDMTFQVHLIWGTDGEKPKDKPLKPVDTKLEEKLKGVFKWRNYYEVNHQPLALPKDNNQKLTLSDKCEIQVQDLGNSRVEVRLFGEGRPVVKKAQSIPPGEIILLGGESKNDTAWFVMLVRTK